MPLENFGRVDLKPRLQYKHDQSSHNLHASFLSCDVLTQFCKKSVSLIEVKRLLLHLFSFSSQTEKRSKTDDWNNLKTPVQQADR